MDLSTAIRKPLPLDCPAPTKKVLPVWRTRPTRSVSAIDYDYTSLCDAIDEYFTLCAEEGRPPMVSEMVLAVGFDSSLQLLNHARRKGPDFLRVISRALLALQVTYEEMLQDGVKTATWMLERIPEFDSVEPATQPPAYSHRISQQVDVHVTGIVRPEEIGKQLTAQEAYLAMIKHKSIEDLRTEVQTLALDEDGVYKVVEVG